MKQIVDVTFVKMLVFFQNYVSVEGILDNFLNLVKASRITATVISDLINKKIIKTEEILKSTNLDRTRLNTWISHKNPTLFASAEMFQFLLRKDDEGFSFPAEIAIKISEIRILTNTNNSDLKHSSINKISESIGGTLLNNGRYVDEMGLILSGNWLCFRNEGGTENIVLSSLNVSEKPLGEESNVLYFSNRHSYEGEVYKIVGFTTEQNGSYFFLQKVR